MILMIDDNPDFGGHQLMAAYALEGMLKFARLEVLALSHPQNQKNLDRWESIRAGAEAGLLRIAEAPTRTSKFQALRRFIQRSATRRLLEIVQREQPDVILVVQGNIEQCANVLGLKGRVACPVISYLPLPHKHAEMGAKLGAIRDVSCRGLYGEPDGFIVISETLGRMLAANGAAGRIQVVENGIPLDLFKDQPTPAEARAQFNLPQEGYLWGQTGRIEFKQKGQDFALKVFLERLKVHGDEHLVFLGSGPDREALEAASAAHANVHCLPWTDNPAPLYAAVDGMILPSRYEGVPLAMLEALANGVPVASTDRDGMRDWLPEVWRFAYRDCRSAHGAMDAVRNADTSVIDSLKQRIWKDHTVEHFQRRFSSAITEWLPD